MGNWNGIFNIVFPGATINCNSKERIKALQDYINGTCKTYYITPSLSSSKEELKDAILYNTTYFHESRHVHDYLLCPILNYGYRLRLLTVLHTCQALLGWDDSNSFNYNTLPVPIQKWFRLPNEEKQEYLNNWSFNGHPAKASMLYVGSSSFRDYIQNKNIMSQIDSITSLLLYASGYYETYTHINNNSYDIYYREYSVKTLLEASAICVQLASAELLFGENASSIMWQVLKEATKRENEWKNLDGAKRKLCFTSYTTVISLISSYLNKLNKTIGTENLLIFTPYLINWCLSGNLLSSDAITSPATRLHTFVQNDLAKGMTIKDIENDPIAAFSYWDAKLGCKGLDYHNYFADNRRIYEQIASSFNEIGMPQIADYTQMISKASQTMLKLFHQNPNRYLNPGEYIKNFLSYVNVPIRFKLSEPIEIIQSNVFNIELEPNLSTRDNDGKIVYSITADTPILINPLSHEYTTSEYPILKYKKSIDFQEWFQISEMIFNENSSVKIEDTIKMFTKNCQIKFLI